MTWVPDLSPCPHWPEGRQTRAIGWLGRGHAFPTAPVDPELIRLLERWPRSPHAPPVEQRCELCASACAESGSVIVPFGQGLYVAPRLIIHFIREHGYAPPEEFVRALGEAALDATLESFDAAGPNDFALEGNDVTRLNAERFVGSTGREGLHALLRALVHLALAQHMWGATRLQVEVEARGWVTVEDDGFGLRHAPRPLEALFTRRGLMGQRQEVVSPRFRIWRTSTAPGYSVACALSERMEVESRRAGLVQRVAFERGRVVEPTVCVGQTSDHGLRVRYRPDADIFDAHVALDLQSLERELTELAWLCPGLELVFQGRSLQRGTGLVGWVQELAGDAVEVLTVSGSVDGVELEAALGWNAGRTAPLTKGFINHAAIRGAHEEGVLDAVRQAARARGVEAARVVRGVVAVVHVGVGDTSRFDERVQAAVCEVVSRTIAASPWWWDRLCERLAV